MENHLLHFSGGTNYTGWENVQRGKISVISLFSESGFRIRQPWLLLALIHLLENKSTYLKLRLFKIELTFLISQVQTFKQAFMIPWVFFASHHHRKGGHCAEGQSWRDDGGQHQDGTVWRFHQQVFVAQFNELVFDVLFSSQDECYLCELYCERSSKRREESEVMSI